MAATKRRVIGYKRVSTTEQVKHGYSLEDQDRAIRAHCRAKGMRLVAMLADEGQSGSNGLDSRQGLAEALARIERGEAEVLLVKDLDRLARDLLLQLTIIEQLKAAGVEVVAIEEPEVDGPDHLRELFRNVLGSIAQYERAVIRGRMMAGKAAKRAQGGYTGGRPPYGLAAKDRALVANPEEQQVVELVQRMREQGESYRSICAALAEAGHRPKSGGEWQPMTVRRIAMRSEGVRTT